MAYCVSDEEMETVKLSPATYDAPLDNETPFLFTTIVLEFPV